MKGLVGIVLKIGLPGDDCMVNMNGITQRSLKDWMDISMRFMLPLLSSHRLHCYWSELLYRPLLRRC